MRTLVLAMSALLLLPACASTGGPHAVRTAAYNPNATVNDPLEQLNRGVYKFNDGVDRYFIGPAARGYYAVTPKFVRNRVRDFTDNLGAPFVFANEVLQLDFKDASRTLRRFVANTTVGVGGLFDIAETEGGLAKNKEDLGQTLATYGVKPGPYIVFPLLGPTNFRDLTGTFGELAANPLTYTDFKGDTAFRSGTSVLGGLGTRARAEGQLRQIRKSADPYVSLREMYYQSRNKEIHEDGDPLDSLPEFDDFDTVDTDETALLVGPPQR